MTRVIMFSERTSVECAFQWARRIAAGDEETVLDEIIVWLAQAPDNLWVLADASARLTANLLRTDAFVTGQDPDSVDRHWVMAYMPTPEDPDITTFLQVVTALLNYDYRAAKDLIVAHVEQRQQVGLLALAETGLATAATIMQLQPWMMT